MDESTRDLAWGIGMVALVGGAVRAGVALWALRQGKAYPAQGAVIAAVLSTVVALLGLVSVIWAATAR